MRFDKSAAGMRDLNPRTEAAPAQLCHINHNNTFRGFKFHSVLKVLDFSWI